MLQSTPMTGLSDSLVFPASFYEPSKECGWKTYYSGPYRSANVKSYLNKRDSPWLSAVAAAWNDHMSWKDLQEMQENIIAQEAQKQRVIDATAAQQAHAGADMNTWDRLYSDDKYRRKRAEAVASNADRRYYQQDMAYAFSPAIIERPGERPRPAGSGIGGSATENDHWEVRLYSDPVKGIIENEQKGKPVSIAPKDSRENAELIEECTFQPKANRAAQGQEPSGDTTQVFARLYENGLAHTKLKNSDRIPEAIKHLTFHPTITASPTKDQGNAKIYERLYEDGKRAMEHRNDMDNQIDRDIRSKYSFHPKIEVHPGVSARYMEIPAKREDPPKYVPPTTVQKKVKAFPIRLFTTPTASQSAIPLPKEQPFVDFGSALDRGTKVKKSSAYLNDLVNRLTHEKDEKRRLEREKENELLGKTQGSSQKKRTSTSSTGSQQSQEMIAISTTSPSAQEAAAAAGVAAPIPTSSPPAVPSLNTALAGVSGSGPSQLTPNSQSSDDRPPSRSPRDGKPEKKISFRTPASPSGSPTNRPTRPTTTFSPMNTIKIYRDFDEDAPPPEPISFKSASKARLKSALKGAARARHSFRAPNRHAAFPPDTPSPRQRDETKSPTS